MRHPELPQLGRIVEIVRGRNRGMVGIVVGYVPDRFVLIADGLSRKAEKPKKKNVLHIRSTPHHALEVQAALTAEGKVTNAKLRYALRMYEGEHSVMQTQSKGGGTPVGEG